MSSGWNALIEDMDREIITHLDESEIYYTPAGGVPVLVAGVFDENHVDLAGGQAGIVGARPMVFCRLSDLPEDPDREVLGAIEADGVDYDVVEVRKDGQGAVRLFLHRADTPYIAPLPGEPDIEVVED